MTNPPVGELPTAVSRLLQPAGSRALITGGGTGIGRAVALLLAEWGVTVWILGRRPDPLEETTAMAPDGQIHPIQTDIRDAESVDRAFSQAEVNGPIDILVNAAGGAFLAHAEDITPNGFAAVTSSSLIGPFNVIRRWARPLLMQKIPGCALVVSSALAAREVPGAAHSSASKAGLEALVRSLAVEWGPRGLRINALAPGAFDTEGAAEGMWSDDRVKAATLSGIPMGRFGSMDELIGAAAFLLARSSSYMTGGVLTVDGGWHLSGYPFGHELPARDRGALTT